MHAITHGDPQLVPNSSSVRTGGEDMLNYFENPRAALLVRVLRFTDVSVEHAGMNIQLPMMNKPDEKANFEGKLGIPKPSSIRVRGVVGM